MHQRLTPIELNTNDGTKPFAMHQYSICIFLKSGTERSFVFAFKIASLKIRQRIDFVFEVSQFRYILGIYTRGNM